MSSANPPGRVLYCVSGGIAAYKAPEIVRGLVKRGFEVQVIMTPAAAAFVTPLSLATVSGRPVRTQLLDASEEGQVGHIELADWADVVLVAPATANVMARAAHGLADDLVTTCLLATRAPVVWAPAMNTNMWNHPGTRANLATLRDRGATFVGPDRGDLACGWVGEGRMIDPPIIVEAVAERLATVRGGSWAGRRVMVSAGPTREPLDPVRFISNASTGAMGYALAEQAALRGAEVLLVSGPVDRPTPAGVRRVDVGTAAQMLQAMSSELEAAPWDLVAMVAAVADVAMADPEAAKLGKSEVLDRLGRASWSSTVDVLATLTQRHADRAYYLGFAAQTVDETVAEGGAGAVADALVELGRAKLERKGCDALFVNRVGVPGLGFGSDTNAGHLLFASPSGSGPIASGEPTPKPALAGWMLDRLAEHLAQE